MAKTILMMLGAWVLISVPVSLLVARMMDTKTLADGQANDGAARPNVRAVA